MLARGELESVDALSRHLTTQERADVQREIERFHDDAERLVQRRASLKEALMKKLGSDGAITSSDGQVYLAGRGSLTAQLQAYDEFGRYVQDQFLANVVNLFAAFGLLDDVRATALLDSYSRAR